MRSDSFPMCYHPGIAGRDAPQSLPAQIAATSVSSLASRGRFHVSDAVIRSSDDEQRLQNAVLQTDFEKSAKIK